MSDANGSETDMVKVYHMHYNVFKSEGVELINEDTLVVALGSGLKVGRAINVDIRWPMLAPPKELLERFDLLESSAVDEQEVNEDTFHKRYEEYLEGDRVKEAVSVLASYLQYHSNICLICFNRSLENLNHLGTLAEEIAQRWASEYGSRNLVETVQK